ncbi:Ubiquitin-conjugating enzyme E2 34 [Capsicum annuum]|nr:Ubiquitin-conjugating enzyme E2 34 [Capsicum annuum]
MQHTHRAALIYGEKEGALIVGDIAPHFPPCGSKSKSAYHEKHSKRPCSTNSMTMSSASYMICALELSNISIYPHCPKYGQRDCSPNFSMLLGCLLTLPSDDSFTQRSTWHDPMDNSPTTGSVSTTVAEKEKLAKASLAFNCKNPTFRKLFPEYVEKYEQQQLQSQPVPEQASSMPAGAETSRPLLEEHGNSTKDEVNRVKPLNDVKNQQRKSCPTWLLLLLVSIFGVVMALPLLQL